MTDTTNTDSLLSIQLDNTDPRMYTVCKRFLDPLSQVYESPEIKKAVTTYLSGVATEEMHQFRDPLISYVEARLSVDHYDHVVARYGLQKGEILGMLGGKVAFSDRVSEDDRRKTASWGDVHLLGHKGGNMLSRIDSAPSLHNVSTVTVWWNNAPRYIFYLNSSVGMGTRVCLVEVCFPDGQAENRDMQPRFSRTRGTKSKGPLVLTLPIPHPPRSEVTMTRGTKRKNEDPTMPRKKRQRTLVPTLSTFGLGANILGLIRPPKSPPLTPPPLTPLVIYQSGFLGTDTCDFAAKKGNIKVLRRARAMGRPWSLMTCAYAAEGGHLAIMKSVRRRGCPWGGHTWCYAAKSGNLAIMKWARANGCPLDSEAYLLAAKGGHLDVLEWMKKNDDPVHPNFLAQVSYAGRLDILMMFVDNGASMDELICHNAAETGNLEILEWAKAIGCTWAEGSRTCGVAAHSGHLTVLKWLVENGVRPNDKCIPFAARGGKLDVLEWLVEGMSPPCPWTPLVYSYAASHGHLHIIKWAKGLGLDTHPWDETACHHAASGGQLAILKWLRKEGCPWDDRVCHFAVSNGRLDILEWVVENGCPLTKASCEIAAFRGHLAILKWLREEAVSGRDPCPWDEVTCAAAAKGNNLGVLKWLREGDEGRISEGGELLDHIPCPWDATTCDGAKDYGNYELLMWAKAHGCPN